VGAVAAAADGAVLLTAMPKETSVPSGRGGSAGRGKGLLVLSKSRPRNPSMPPVLGGGGAFRGGGVFIGGGGLEGRPAGVLLGGQDCGSVTPGQPTKPPPSGPRLQPVGPVIAKPTLPLPSLGSQAAPKPHIGGGSTRCGGGGGGGVEEEEPTCGGPNSGGAGAASGGIA